MTSILESNDILTKISIKRRALIEVANLKGLTNKETVECSQELDILINSYFKIKKSSDLC